MKKLSIAIIALSALFSGATFAAKDTVRIGVDATFPPFESIDADGNLQGFEIEIGNAICAEMNKTCQWVSSDFDGLIPSLMARKIDAVFSSLGITEKRQRQVRFTDVVWTGYSSMVSKESEQLKPTLESLKGKSIGVQMGSMQEDFVRARFEEHGVTVKTYQSQETVYADLLSGRIDVSFQDMIQAQFNFIDGGNNSDYVNTPVVDEMLPADTAIAVRKNDKALAQWFNQGLQKIHDNGTYDAIQTKYFGDLKLYAN